MNLDEKSPLARRMKEARKAAGVTQEELGVLAGLEEAVASTRMSQYENEVHMPNFGFIKKIAEVLDIPTAYFYCEENELAIIIKDFKSDECL